MFLSRYLCLTYFCFGSFQLDETKTKFGWLSQVMHPEKYVYWRIQRTPRSNLFLFMEFFGKIFAKQKSIHNRMHTALFSSYEGIGWADPPVGRSPSRQPPHAEPCRQTPLYVDCPHVGRPLPGCRVPCWR